MTTNPYNMDGEYETPYGIGRCISLGSITSANEAKFTASFQVGELVVRWWSDDGFMTDQERSKKNWMKEFDKLSKRDSYILAYGFPNIENHDDFRKIDAPARLVLKSAKKAIKAGIISADECTRCHGSGKHSYCERLRDVCFKCEGSGLQLPPLSKVKKAIMASKQAS